MSTVRIPLKIQELTDLTCYNSFNQALNDLPNRLYGEAPTDITNVIISNVQPQDTQRDAMWVRMSNSGSFIGIYFYSGGTWRQLAPAPNEIFRVYGDSRTIEEGFTLADESNPNLTADQGVFLRTQWHRDPTNTFYDIFDVTYTGF